MIFCLTCDCGGAEPMIREILRKAGHKDWLTKQIYRGREVGLKFLSDPRLANVFECQALANHIRESSSYVVILGIKGNKVYWSDAANGSVADRLDAEICAEKFA